MASINKYVRRDAAHGRLLLKNCKILFLFSNLRFSNQGAGDCTGCNDSVKKAISDVMSSLLFVLSRFSSCRVTLVKYWDSGLLY